MAFLIVVLSETLLNVLRVLPDNWKSLNSGGGDLPIVLTWTVCLPLPRFPALYVASWVLIVRQCTWYGAVRRTCENGVLVRRCPRLLDDISGRGTSPP